MHLCIGNLFSKMVSFMKDANVESLLLTYSHLINMYQHPLTNTHYVCSERFLITKVQQRIG